MRLIDHIWRHFFNPRTFVCLADTVLHLFFDSAHLVSDVFTGSVRAEHQVDQPAQHREQQDGNKPCNLEGRIALVVDDAQSQQQAEQHTEGIKVNEVVVQLPDDPKQQQRLQYNQQSGQNYPLRNEAQNFSHPISPLFNIIFIYLTIFFSFFQSSNEGHLPPDGPFG